MNRQQSDSVRLKSSSATRSNSSPPSRYSITRITSTARFTLLHNISSHLAGGFEGVDETDDVRVGEFLQDGNFLNYLSRTKQNDTVKHRVCLLTFSFCSFRLVLMCFAA